MTAIDKNLTLDNLTTDTDGVVRKRDEVRTPPMGTSGFFLALCADLERDVFKPINEIDPSADVFSYGSGKHRVTVALRLDSAGYALMGGSSATTGCTPDGDTLLKGVRERYKLLDPKIRNMGKKPSGSAVVKEVLSALCGQNARHVSEIVSRVRRDVWTLLPSGEIDGTGRETVETSEGTVTIYRPGECLDYAIDANAFKRAMAFMTATNEISAQLSGIGKLAVVPTKERKDGSVTYSLRKVITLEQALGLLAQVGWRTPGSRLGGNMILPVIDTSTKKEFIETHGQETWDRLVTAKGAAMTALHAHRLEAIETIMGAKPLSVAAVAARAVQTGAHYRQILLDVAPELVNGCETLGALTGFVAALDKPAE